MKKFEGMILACDMDGTLLDNNRQISPRNQQALRYFTQEGGRFSLATGRAPQAIECYIPQLPFNAPYSLLNGSLILDEKHHVLQCAGMPECTKDLIEITLSEFSQLGCEIFAGTQVLIRKMSDVTENHIKVLDMKYSMVTQEELGDTAGWCKINFTGDPALMHSVREFLKPYTDRFCIASSLASFCEITAHGVNKGTALQQIAASCGIAADHTFAIGDSYNDEPMLEAAHIGFAPANADDGILKTADVVVCANDKDAVANAIEYMEAHFC